MLVKPLAPRHYSEDIGSSLVITIPSRKNWFLMIFLGIWMVGWLAGEVVVGAAIVASILGRLGSEDAPILFLLFWFTFWTVGGIFGIYAFFWQIVGREEIDVTASSIIISQVVLFFRRSKKYASEYIKDLRTSPMGMNEMHNWYRMWAFYGVGGGIIVFDYGAATIRMGSGIDEAEGKQIITEIQQRYPQYKN